MEFAKPQQYQAVIEKKEQLTENIFLVTFHLVAPTTVSFIAGQTFVLDIGSGVKRTMSIASAPSDTTHIVMCHDVSPGGPGSLWTITHAIGDTATILVPAGRFILDKALPRKKVMIATGTGVAPFHSMIIDYLENGGTDDVTLYWGLRQEEDMYWFDEFTQLSAAYPNFRFVFTLSQPSDGWKGKRGRVTEYVTKEEHNLTGSDYYLCGNQMMVKQIKEQLASYHVPSGQVHHEMFY